MKKEGSFMMIFRYEPDPDYTPTEQEQARMHEQWGAFIGNLALTEKLISTHQLGFEGTQISAEGSLAEGIYVSEKGTIGGNMVVKANSLDEATEMAKESPILQMGGTVEIRNIVPMN